VTPHCTKSSLLSQAERVLALRNEVKEVETILRRTQTDIATEEHRIAAYKREIVALVQPMEIARKSVSHVTDRLATAKGELIQCQAEYNVAEQSLNAVVKECEQLRLRARNANEERELKSRLLRLQQDALLRELDRTHKDLEVSEYTDKLTNQNEVLQGVVIRRDALGMTPERVMGVLSYGLSHREWQLAQEVFQKADPEGNHSVSHEVLRKMSTYVEVFDRLKSSETGQVTFVLWIEFLQELLVNPWPQAPDPKAFMLALLEGMTVVSN